MHLVPIVFNEQAAMFWQFKVKLGYGKVLLEQCAKPFTVMLFQCDENILMLVDGLRPTFRTDVGNLAGAAYKTRQ
jgi:hypothetical protein